LLKKHSAANKNYSSTFVINQKKDRKTDMTKVNSIVVGTGGFARHHIRTMLAQLPRAKK
jgi:hypothetical protein